MYYIEVVMDKNKPYRNLYASILLSLVDDLKKGAPEVRCEIASWLLDDDYRSQIIQWSRWANCEPEIVLNKLDKLALKYTIIAPGNRPEIGPK